MFCSDVFFLWHDEGGWQVIHKGVGSSHNYPKFLNILSHSVPFLFTLSPTNALMPKPWPNELPIPYLLLYPKMKTFGGFGPWGHCIAENDYDRGKAKKPKTHKNLNIITSILFLSDQIIFALNCPWDDCGNEWQRPRDDRGQSVCLSVGGDLFHNISVFVCSWFEVICLFTFASFSLGLGENLMTSRWTNGAP